jgi:hypothetical protein
MMHPPPGGCGSSTSYCKIQDDYKNYFYSYLHPVRTKIDVSIVQVLERRD